MEQSEAETVIGKEAVIQVSWHVFCGCTDLAFVWTQTQTDLVLHHFHHGHRGPHLMMVICAILFGRNTSAWL